MPEPEQPPRPSPVNAAIERVKKHPVITVIATVVSLLVFLTTVTDLFGRIGNAVTSVADPYAAQQASLDRIDLGVTPAFLEQQFGPPKRSDALCRVTLDCPPEAAGRPLTLVLYATEPVAVRAIFDESGLQWYAVTSLKEEFQPQVRWLDHDIGPLGARTYADSLRGAGVEPTDVDMFLGPQSSTYVEVVAAGAPARYRGLVQATVPGAVGDFNRDAADPVEVLNERPFDAAVAEPFRSTSRPNTFGEFVDDGDAVSDMARDAEFHRVVFYSFG